MSPNWSLDRERELRQLWHEGLSASAIAERLGGVSRNAVIGKARRLSLEARTASVWKSPRARASKARAPIKATPKSIPSRSDPTRSDPGSPHCQWIEGDVGGDWSFCQERKRARSSYCAAHHARCYVARDPDQTPAAGRRV